MRAGACASPANWDTCACDGRLGLLAFTQYVVRPNQMQPSLKVMTVLRELLGEPSYHPADRVAPLLRSKRCDVRPVLAGVDVRNGGSEGDVTTPAPRCDRHVRLAGSADLKVRRERDEWQH